MALSSQVKTGNVPRIRARSSFCEMGSPFLITGVGARERGISAFDVELTNLNLFG